MNVLFWMDVTGKSGAIQIELSNETSEKIIVQPKRI